jgi:hypothetical protein
MGAKLREALVKGNVSSETSVGVSRLKERPKPVFGEAEKLLLDEARERFDFEQQSAGALHSKSTLFLSMTGVFAAIITAVIGRLLDRIPNSVIEKAALCALFLSLGLLTVAAIRLGFSTLSRSYQVIATPSQWLEHLARLKEFSKRGGDPDDEVFAYLQQDILNAWVEAAEECNKANNARASSLNLVLKLHFAAIFLAFVGVLLLILQKIFN